METNKEMNGATSQAFRNGISRTRKVDRSVQADLDPLEDQNKIQNVGIFQLVLDEANLCTLTGTVLATTALANVWRRRYFLGLALSILASLADILDGPIARSKRKRAQPIRTVGKYLDMYSDVISHFVVPASLLMELSDLNPLCVILAAVFVCTGVLRHARHEIIERLDGGSCAYGVTSDYLVSTFAIVMHVALVVEKETLVIVLSVVMIISVFVSLSKSFKSRRYSGMNLLVAGIFHLWLALSCSFIRYLLISEESDRSFWVSDESFYTCNGIRFYGFTIGQLVTGFLIAHLTLAYPCYFRYIEINA